MSFSSILDIYAVFVVALVLGMLELSLEDLSTSVVSKSIQRAFHLLLPEVEVNVNQLFLCLNLLTSEDHPEQTQQLLALEVKFYLFLLV